MEECFVVFYALFRVRSAKKNEIRQQNEESNEISSSSVVLYYGFTIMINIGPRLDFETTAAIK